MYLIIIKFLAIHILPNQTCILFQSFWDDNKQSVLATIFRKCHSGLLGGTNKAIGREGDISFLVACVDVGIGVYCRCIPSLEVDKAMHISKGGWVEDDAICVIQQPHWGVQLGPANPAGAPPSPPMLMPTIWGTEDNVQKSPS